MLNRGNFRSAIIQDDAIKAAFLKCLGEGGEKAGWLAEDQAAQKAQRFAQMSQGWVIGAKPFWATFTK